MTFLNYFLQNVRLSRQSLPFTVKSLANYFISLEKSPLSNILRLHDKALMFHDLPRPKIWGSLTPQIPQDRRLCIGSPFYPAPAVKIRGGKAEETTWCYVGYR